MIILLLQKFVLGAGINLLKVLTDKKERVGFGRIRVSKKV